MEENDIPYINFQIFFYGNSRFTSDFRRVFGAEPEVWVPYTDTIREFIEISK